MRFIKMTGLGNDYVYVDCFAENVPPDPSELAVRIADRHFGVGGDGLILVRPSSDADARMQMFNADGSEAEMCGNGIRCVAKYVFESGICRREHLAIETGNGVLQLDLQLAGGESPGDLPFVTQVRVDMGEPILAPAQIPATLEPTEGHDGHIVEQTLKVGGETFHATCVSMGNPHCVIFAEDVSDDLVLGYGPQIERHAAFPNRVNVEFVKVESPTEVRQRTWERGSGETLACGTGACAVCVAGVLTGKTQRKIVNHLLGGDLVLDWSESDHHVYMTGPAVEVFRGEWPDCES